jgi:hypothetical protein
MELGFELLMMSGLVAPHREGGGCISSGFGRVCVDFPAVCVYVLTSRLQAISADRADRQTD